MPEHTLDYNQVASTYNHRFKDDPAIKRVQVLSAAANQFTKGEILEVGCGTGFWLANLAPVSKLLFGLDRSSGMLTQAKEHQDVIHLTQGDARHLPYKDQSFKFIYCYNAIHHFDEPEAFVREAYRLVKPGGKVAIIGSNPHERKDDWYIYHYFKGTYEKDVARFPKWSVIENWLRKAGFTDLKLEEIDFIDTHKTGSDVLDDPFLQKNACSQLALLTDNEYARGINKIKDSIQQSGEKNMEIVFHSRIHILMLTARKK